MSIKNNSELKTYFQKGKKPTETQFGDLIDSLSLPYGCYTALMYQSGADAPEVNVLLNNTEVDFLWERVDAGFYSCRLPRNIESYRLFVTVRDQGGPREDISVRFTSGRIRSIELVCPGDGLLLNTLVEIRYYNDERVVATKMDEGLARYFGYFKKEDLVQDGNLYLSPSEVYRPVSGKETDGREEGTGTAEAIPARTWGVKSKWLDLFRVLDDRYVILPEILDEGKNPFSYNMDTNRFCNFYIIENGVNFIKNSVKKSLEAGAEECVLFLKNDHKVLTDNMSRFKTAVNSDNDKGIKNIKVIYYSGEETMMEEFTLEDLKQGGEQRPPRKMG